METGSDLGDRNAVETPAHLQQHGGPGRRGGRVSTRVAAAVAVGSGLLVAGIVAGLAAYWRTPSGRTLLLPLALAVAGPPTVVMAETHAHDAGAHAHDAGAHAHDAGAHAHDADTHPHGTCCSACGATETIAPAVPDTTGYAKLLNAFVDDRGMVAYRDLAGSAEHLNALDRYIKALSAMDLASLDRDQKLATMINAYNAFTLRLILDHMPIDSIYDIPEAKRWKAERWTLGGEMVSLDRLEHEWIRPNFREPRIHWALVCAAYSCPKLRSEPYTAGALNQQLDEQAEYVHQDRRFFYFENGVLYITELYNWFRGDFEQVDGSPLQHAARYSPRLAGMLAKGQTPKTLYIPYSWSLNDQAKHQ